MRRGVAASSDAPPDVWRAITTQRLSVISTSGTRTATLTQIVYR